MSTLVFLDIGYKVNSNHRSAKTFLLKHPKDRYSKERAFRGSVPEWLMGADCKSAAQATLVQIQPGPPERLASL
jgi:hypothetical protein